ncbi:MAG: anion permease, partial [Blautia sp.]|nr:anion permease [Blautia sp.]
VTEALPLGIVCLLAVSMMYFFNCTDTVPGALSGFTNATLFFVLASFGISEALTVVPASKRLLLFLMKKFGQNTERLMLAIMIVTAVLSSVISNVAAAAVFIPVVTHFLEVYENEEAKRRTGRAYMISLPVASMIGGMMTPAGSSINMLTISMLEKNTGRTISFVQWMVMGIPVVIVMLPAAWFLCVRIFKPAPLEEKIIQSYIENARRDVPEKMTIKEKYVIFILGVMLVLWILSSWYPRLQIAPVAIIGLALYFIPGRMQILTWNDFKRCVSLEAFLLLGVMISMGNVITSSGLSAWISRVVFPAEYAGGTLLTLVFVCTLTFLLLIPIPVAPALVAMLSAPLVHFCQQAGVSPALVMAAFGLCACNCYLLPLDTVPLITYSTGYYKMFDMPKATVFIQLLMIVVCSLWLTAAGTFLF